MLTLGVPGSGTTAVMMGALTLYNITPGPVLFDAQPQIVWGLIASLFVANAASLMNVPMVRLFAPRCCPSRLDCWFRILAISFIGVYAINATRFDLLMVVGIGVIGYFLRKMNVPMAPMVLGVVLGDMMEQNLRRALSITNGELGILYESPVSKGLWIAAILVAFVPPMLRRIAKKKAMTQAN